MTFRRTSVGLRNQPIFVSADIVVYVEGVDAIVDGELAEVPGSQDSLFWAEVLGCVLPNSKLHFKSMGSKNALMEFSSGLDDKVRGTLLICVDNDFQDLMPRTVSLNYVVSTYRYSWESDIWVWRVFLQVLAVIIPVGRIPEELVQAARTARDRFFMRIGRYVRLDYQTALSRATECFISRDNPAAASMWSANGFPIVNSPYFRSRARALRRALARPWKPGRASEFNVKRHAFGKAIDRFHCMLLVSSIKSMNLPSTIPFVYLQNLAIRHLRIALFEPERKRQLDHYRSAVEAAL